jgi:hypothetical protein
VLGCEKAEQFGPDPLARERAQACPLPYRRQQALAVEGPAAMLGREAEEAQRAQEILADAPVRVADEADMPGGEIGEPARVIVQPSVRPEREGVHGEVAPQGVAAEIPSESHGGVAAIGVDVLAQRRDLERHGAGHDRHGPVGEPGRDRAQARPAGALQRGLGQERGREIDIGHGPAEQCIPHRAADDTRFFALAGQRREDAHGLRPTQQPGQGDRGGGGHLNRPGTSTPFSTWVGTKTPV